MKETIKKLEEKKVDSNPKLKKSIKKRLEILKEEKEVLK